MTMLTAATVYNTGSSARDYCMLERNMLSHVKLSLLLSLLSSSMILHARLSPPAEDCLQYSLRSGVPVASILLFSSLLSLVAGTWEYWLSDNDMRKRRAFMVANK